MAHTCSMFLAELLTIPLPLPNPLVQAGHREGHSTERKEGDRTGCHRKGKSHHEERKVRKRGERSPFNSEMTIEVPFA